MYLCICGYVYACIYVWPEIQYRLYLLIVYLHMTRACMHVRTFVCVHTCACVCVWFRVNNKELYLVYMALHFVYRSLVYLHVFYVAATFSPIVSAPQVLFGMVGSESNYTFSVISSTGIAAVAIAINETVRNTNDSLPSNMKLVQVNSTTLSLLWTPLHRYETFTLDLIRFVLLGNSEPIALSRSLITPQIQLCDCQNGGTCTTDGVLQYDQNFILLQCLCLTGRRKLKCDERFYIALHK